MYADRLFCGQEKIEGLWTSCEKVNSQFPQKRKSDQHVKDPSHARHVIPRLFVFVFCGLRSRVLGSVLVFKGLCFRVHIVAIE